MNYILMPFRWALAILIVLLIIVWLVTVGVGEWLIGRYRFHHA